MKIGFIGLGKMGSRIVEKLLRSGHSVVAWNRTPQTSEEFYQSMVGQNLAQNLTLAKSIKELVQNLQSPRIIWSMLPAGDATEYALQDVAQLVSPNDIVIDGGNANYKDTQRRYDEFTKKDIRFLGIGASGGIHAVKNGYPFMVGGNKSAYEELSPVLSDLSKPNGSHTYFGKGGAGHFVKMVHNGIEYGMMQAIGEGFGVLEKSPYAIDLLAAAKNWQHGTIITSFLVDCAKEALQKDQQLSSITGVIAASGEGQWTVEAAKDENVPIENIEQSLTFRERSQTDKTIQNSFAARLIAAIRQEFGGHDVVSVVKKML